MLAASRPSSLPMPTSSPPSSSKAPFTGTPTAEYPAYEYPLNPPIQPSPPFISGRTAAGYFPPALVAASPQKDRRVAKAAEAGPVPPRLVGMLSQKEGMQAGTRTAQRA